MNSLQHCSLIPGPTHMVNSVGITSLADGRLRARTSQYVPALPCWSQTGPWGGWLACAKTVVQEDKHRA